MYRHCKEETDVGHCWDLMGQIGVQPCCDGFITQCSKSKWQSK